MSRAPSRRPTRHLLMAGLALAAVSGCAGSGTVRQQIRVAVLPLDAVGPAAEHGERRLRGLLHGALRRAEGLSPVEPARVEKTLRAAEPCRGGQPWPERCAVDVGQTLGASHVLTGALGALDKAYVIQLKVVDVARGTVSRSLEEAQYGSEAALDASAERVVGRLFDTRGSKPWYRRWWVWVVAGGVAVAAAAAVAVPLALRREDSPYEPVSLP